MRKFTVPALILAAGLAAVPANAGFEGPSGSHNTGDPAAPLDSFDAIFRIEYGIDDNVESVPDRIFFVLPPGTQKDSQYAEASFSGTLRHRFNHTIDAGLALVASARRHFDDYIPSNPASLSFDEYDTMIVSPRLFVNVLLEGVDLQLYYQFRNETGHDVNAIGLNAHTIGFDAIRDLSPTWRIRGGASWTNNDHAVDFTGSEIFNDRDSAYFRINAGADYFIQGGRAVLSATAFSAINDSDGLNWNYTSYGASLGAKAMIVPRLFASASVGFEHRDYDNGFFAPWLDAPGRTDQDIVTASARLTYAIDDRFSVDAFVNHSEFGANDIPASNHEKIFEGDKTVFGVGLNVKLF